MAFRRKTGGWKQPEQAAAPGTAPGAPPDREPTFTIKQSKQNTPYAMISGRVAPTGRAGAMLMLFPSKFQGQFAGLAINGWGRGMVPVLADQIDVDDKTGTVTIDLGFLKIQVTGENVAEFVEFLQYVQEMPRQAGGFPSQAAPSAPAKPSWKK